MKIIYSGLHTNWVYGARHYLVFLFHMLICILFTTVISLSIGVYNTVKLQLPETIIAMTFTGLVFYEGMYQTAMLTATQIPLGIHLQSFLLVVQPWDISHHHFRLQNIGTFLCGYDSSSCRFHTFKVE